MSHDLLPEPEPLVNPLYCYNLHNEKPKWHLAFEARLELYGDRGLRDFLAYLDSVLDQPNIGVATKEEYSRKRDEVTRVLDQRQETRAENRVEKEFVYPSDFNN